MSSRKLDQQDRAVQATFDAFVEAVKGRDFKAYRKLHIEEARDALDSARFEHNCDKAARERWSFALRAIAYEGDVAEARFEVSPDGGGPPDQETLTMVREQKRYLIVES